MTKTKLYSEIRRRCNFIIAEPSSDYIYRTEYWKHGCVIYKVLFKVCPRRDRILRIYGSTLAKGGFLNGKIYC